MRRIILAALALCFFATPVLADLDTSGLTAQQVADLKAEIAQTQADNAKRPVDAKPVLSPDNISEYAKLGRDIGSGLASTAREIGVATNEFAQTPVGHLAMMLIVYKLIGRDLVHYVGGIIWFAITIPIWIIFFRRMYLYKSVEVKYDPTTGKRASVIRTPLDTSDGSVAGGRVVMFIVFVILCTVGFIVTFSGN